MLVEPDQAVAHLLAEDCKPDAAAPRQPTNGALVRVADLSLLYIYIERERERCESQRLTPPPRLSAAPHAAHAAP